MVSVKLLLPGITVVVQASMLPAYKPNLCTAGLQGQEHKSSETDHTHTNGSLPKSALSLQSIQEKLAGSKSLSAQAPKFSPGSQKSMLPESNGNSEEIIVHG